MKVRHAQLSGAIYLAAPEGAIAYKRSDPTEEGRWIYDEDDLRAIRREDPALVVDVEYGDVPDTVLFTLDMPDFSHIDGFDNEKAQQRLEAAVDEVLPKGCTWQVGTSEVIGPATYRNSATFDRAYEEIMEIIAGDDPRGVDIEDPAFYTA